MMKKIQLFPVEQFLTKNFLTEWDFKISHWWERGLKESVFIKKNVTCKYKSATAAKQK